eukprot:g7110.t1
MITSSLRLPRFFIRAYSIQKSTHRNRTSPLTFISGRLKTRLVQPCNALEVSSEGSESDPIINSDSDRGDISPKEWSVLQRVCDKLFPKGVTNWEEFWMNDDFEDWFESWKQYMQEEGGFDPSLPHYDESIDGQRDWLKRATSYLRTRSDYVTMLPYDWAESIHDEPEPNFAKEFDPDWDDWDFRAMMEKRRAREKARREWRRSQKEIGINVHIDTVSIDKRIPEEYREGYNWTDEEVWDIITQKGRALDPRKMKKLPWREVSLDEMPDWAGEGHTYVEEIDEYMINQKLMIDKPEQLSKTTADLQMESQLPDISPLFQEYEIQKEEEEEKEEEEKEEEEKEKEEEEK